VVSLENGRLVGVLRKKQGRICYTTKCYMMEDSLAECASEGNPTG
jgi:hypothetical protein